MRITLTYTIDPPKDKAGEIRAGLDMPDRELSDAGVVETVLEMLPPDCMYRASVEIEE